MSVFFGYLQIENKSRKGMCTVNIKVDEAIMRRINPSLTTTESIGQWVQHQVNLMIQELDVDASDTMDVEELRAMLHETVRKEYSRP